MALCRVLGVGQFHNPPPEGSGLWERKFSISTGQNSIIVYDNGTTEERHGITTWDARKPGVYTVLRGGYQNLVDPDSWLGGVLTDAGYTLQESDESYDEGYDGGYY